MKQTIENVHEFSLASFLARNFDPINGSYSIAFVILVKFCFLLEPQIFLLSLGM